MTGDAKTRFCAGCQRHVHNLSAMPREEAERLLCEPAGRVCVRYEVGIGGAPMTLDYQKPGRIRGGWKLWTVVGAIGACITGAVHALVRESAAPVQTPVNVGRMGMGDIAAPAPAPPPPNASSVVMGVICPIPAPPPPLPVPPPPGQPRRLNRGDEFR
jgi:hypothetical protein